MSAIAAIRRWDARPVRDFELDSMLEAMARRGPDSTAGWTDGSTGLGHGSLNTNRERAGGHVGLLGRARDLSITADARIDNRTELVHALGSLGCTLSTIDEAGLILAAYEAWGEHCVNYLVGDFAFVIWDDGRRVLFGARDHFGTRPLVYYHDPGRAFVAASETCGLLRAPEVPASINRARIADFLVPELECVDKTSTFFHRIFRLPPAHTIRVRATGMELSRYWSPDTSHELHLPSDDDYAEAFLETFSAAVESRLRGANPPAAMLSGGLDSSSVVAVACRALAQTTGQPLQAYSAVASDPENCAETRSVRAVEALPGLKPHHVRLDDLAPFIEDIDAATGNADELFDVCMILPHAIYGCAKRHGVRVLLDGVDGDYVMSLEPSSLPHLVRRGHWLAAARQAVAFAGFYRGCYRPWSSPWRLIGRSFGSALVPETVRQRSREQRHRDRFHDALERTIISRELAREVDLPARLAAVHLQPMTFGSLRLRSTRPCT